jgi:hypothetical protein
MEGNCLLSSPVNCCLYQQEEAPLHQQKQEVLREKAFEAPAIPQRCSTTGQCLIGKDNLGMTVSVAKPSTDNIHINVMVELSALLKHHIFQDLKDTVNLDTVHTTHGRDFS